MIKQITQS